MQEKLIGNLGIKPIGTTRNGVTKVDSLTIISYATVESTIATICRAIELIQSSLNPDILIPHSREMVIISTYGTSISSTSYTPLLQVHSYYGIEDTIAILKASFLHMSPN